MASLASPAWAFVPASFSRYNISVQHPLIYTAPHRLGPVVNDDLFRRLCRSRDYIAANLDQHLRLADAAREAYLSPFHYHRLFTQTFGQTPLEFLTRLRIDRAKELLIRDAAPVTDVCFAVGYESLGTFSTRFRRATGYSPREFQRGLRKIFQVPWVTPYRSIPACYLIHHGVTPF
jgi:AraC-like DNA-binding protein